MENLDFLYKYGRELVDYARYNRIENEHGLNVTIAYELSRDTIQDISLEDFEQHVLFALRIIESHWDEYPCLCTLLEELREEISREKNDS